MMIRAISHMGGGSPSHRCGHPKGPWDRSGIPAYRLHDRVVAYECSTAEFGVIDLIAQQNPETDAEFAPYGDARLADTLLLQFAAIKATEPGLVSCGLQAGLAPQESQESIACFVSFPKRCRGPLEYSLGIMPT